MRDLSEKALSVRVLLAAIQRQLATPWTNDKLRKACSKKTPFNAVRAALRQQHFCRAVTQSRLS